jgi:hypothetical protein
VTLDDKRKLETENDIVNFHNFPDDLVLKVKVGRFSPYGPHGQQLSISDDTTEWATGITQVGGI